MHPAFLNILVLSGILLWGMVLGKMMLWVLDRI
jgi:hypothetical protein